MRQTARDMTDVQLVSDNSSIIARLLLDDQIDIACIFQDGNVGEVGPLIVDEFDEQLI